MRRKSFHLFAAGCAALSLAIAAPALAVGSGGSAGGAGSASSAGNAGSTAQIKTAERQIRRGNYVAATETLRQIVEAQPKNADAWNLLGYVARKRGKFRDAERYYATALEIDPNHVGALEYQGELFVQTGRVDQARANLARLARVCGRCEAWRELDEAIRGGPAM